MNNDFNENIELTMPVNAAYVSAVRLTASSISNRLKFSADEIEDIKSAVSEACNYIIKRADPKRHSSFKIKFRLNPYLIETTIGIPDMQIDSESDSDISLIMIKALVDSMEITDSNNKFNITMYKKHKP